MHGFGLTDRYFSFSCSSLYSLLHVSPQVFCRATRGIYFISQTTQTRGAFHRFSVTLLLLSILIPFPKSTTVQRSFICSSDPTHPPDIGRRETILPRSPVMPTVATLSIPRVRVAHPLILSHARHLALPGFQYGFLLGLCVSHCPQNNMLGLASSFSNLSLNRSLNGRLVVPCSVIEYIVPPRQFLFH